KTKGRGHIVGVNMSIQSYNGTFGFLDGDEKVFVDGEKKPSIHGTGTEDYFSSGWYFNKGEYAGPYNGLVLKDDSLGRISAYRFHILDPIPFKKSINFTIEHGFNNTEVADYSSTVYWYQVEPHVKYPPMIRSGLRIPLRLIPPTDMLEAEKLTFNLGKIRSKVMDMSDYGAEWGGSKQLLIESGPKDEFSLNLNRLEETGYDIRIYYTRGPEYGNADVFLYAEKIGQMKGYAPFIQPGGYLSIPNFINLYNGLSLQFAVAGKDSLSSGYFIGLDGIKLEPKRTFIPEWYVIGPFPNKRRADDSRAGMDSIFPPEVAIDKNQVYPGLNGKLLRWQVLKTPAEGFVSFDKMIRPDQPAVFYALTYIYSPQSRTATLLIGSDDAIKVYYNYNKVYSQRGGRIIEPDQGRSFIKINKGWNKLLLKIENRAGRFGFYARILDRENMFRYDINQELPSNTPVTSSKHIKGK
ncbi:MAG TPA: glycoside hydrolase family 172 protein, partial [Bacteroidales bacterium]|nr:glycoside hydrolase family 172 protein [Bacteroidales bacterium]